MKQLILVRHAKAMKSKEGLPDFVRSLNKKGVKQVKKILKKLKKQGPIPEVFMSSPANRALETAQYFAKAFNYPRKKIILEDELYGPLTDQEFLSLVKGFHDNIGSVIIFGHDPSISGIVKFLAKDFKEDLPPCAVAVIEFKKESWKTIAKGQGELLFFDYPKRTAKHYAELKARVGEDVFKELIQVFKKTDAKATQLNEKNVKKWTQKIAKKFTKTLKAFRKKESKRERIIKKQEQKKVQKKTMKVDIPNKSADKSTDTLINKAPETTKEQEKPKE